MQIVVGRWLIDGYPQVILFDINSQRHAVDEWKKELWDKTYISTSVVDPETDNAILFGFIVTWFLGEVGHSKRKLPPCCIYIYYLPLYGILVISIDLNDRNNTLVLDT